MAGTIRTPAAPDKPKAARFLTVRQGTDAGTSADEAALVRSDDGIFEGATVHGTLVLLTGLQPGAGYTVTRNGAKHCPHCKPCEP